MYRPTMSATFTANRGSRLSLPNVPVDEALTRLTPQPGHVTTRHRHPLGAGDELHHLPR